MPPTWFVVGLIATVAVGFGIPGGGDIPSPWSRLGLIPLALGILLNLAADRRFKKIGTTVKPFEESSALVTTGVFGRTRNPMYLGMVLILLGVGSLLGRLVALVPALALGILLEVVYIRPEEAMLAARFPEEWEAYSSRVRRWI
jgi:protein-S-isoprenylcysteine O-methyltransferase Ste14